MAERISLLNPRKPGCACAPEAPEMTTCAGCDVLVAKDEEHKHYEPGPWDGEPGCGASGTTVYYCDDCAKDA
jgi:hypothetical protein